MGDPIRTVVDQRVIDLRDPVRHMQTRMRQYQASFHRPIDPLGDKRHLHHARAAPGGNRTRKIEQSTVIYFGFRNGRPSVGELFYRVAMHNTDTINPGLP